MQTKYDEITGLYYEDKLPGRMEPLYIVADYNGNAIACGDTKADAERRRMELGLRATTYILEC